MRNDGQKPAREKMDFFAAEKEARHVTGSNREESGRVGKPLCRVSPARSGRTLSGKKKKKKQPQEQVACAGL